MAVLLLLMETYSEWINTSSDLHYMPILYNSKSGNADYQKEQRFYFICLTVFVGNTQFLSNKYSHGGMNGQDSVHGDRILSMAERKQTE